MNAIWKRRLLYLLIGALHPACGQKSPEPEVDDGWLPSGGRAATVQKLTDACAIFLPELQEGRTVTFLLLRDGDTLDVSAPGTTLPRLSAATHIRDRFRTAEKRVPITAKNGRCTAERVQYYEGRDETPTDYRILFHSDEGAGVGDCAEVPLPCQTTANLSIRWCPPRQDCIFPK